MYVQCSFSAPMQIDKSQIKGINITQTLLTMFVLFDQPLPHSVNTMEVMDLTENILVDYL